MSNEELKEVTGGGIKIGIAGLVIGGISFIIGLIDGYLRPYKCR